MDTPRFVHLHLHTDYSLLDGACDLEEMVDEAARREMPTVAVTDHGNLFAAESFYQKAKTRGVKPIIGCEVYVAKGSRHDRGESSQREAENGRTDSPAEPGDRGTNHLVLSCETGIPLVATNDCHYLAHADARAQEVLLCIQTGKTMSDAHRMKFATDQFFFKTAQEMAQVFGEIPDALERTVAIAGRCNVKIDAVQNSFPEFQVPEGRTIDSHFEAVVREGFASRVPVLEARAKQGILRKTLAEYETRLTDEIRMIQQMRYAGYFLIVWDFIRYARAQGVPVGPGRGSAAGSLVSYALQITDVDPLQYDLLFERFLNPERVSMPDIDIDFCQRRRGQGGD